MLRKILISGLVVVFPVAYAQDFPTRPVRLVCANPPGATADFVTRLLARHFSEQWKQPAVVDNRGGAAGLIGTDIVAKAVPDGYTLLVSAPGPLTTHMDARVGGSYRMSFTNFSSGKSHSFGGEYLELISNERIRHTDKFDDPNLPGVMQVTIAFRQVSCGTEINITQEGIPDVIPPEACYLGWQESLTLLAQLVEPEIPDGP